MAYDYSKVVKIGNKVLMSKNGLVVAMKNDEPQPIVLPPQTIRFRFEETDYNPSEIENGGTWTKVADSSYNDWDWYCEDTDWESKFDNGNGWSFTEDNKTSIIATGDMTNVTSVEYMFYDCVGLTSIQDNSFNDVTNANGMFYGCTGLASIPDNSFNNLTNAEYMFQSCTGLTIIPDNSFNNLINANGMFYECTSLTNIPDNSFNNITNANDMFSDCTCLTCIPENSFNNVTDAECMFYGCTALTSIPDNSFNNLTNAYFMFQKCTGLTTIPDNNMFNNVTNVDYMFYECSRLKHGALALYNKWIAGGKVISHIATFMYCGEDIESGLVEFQQIPQSWGGLAAG